MQSIRPDSLGGLRGALIVTLDQEIKTTLNKEEKATPDQERTRMVVVPAYRLQQRTGSQALRKGVGDKGRGGSGQF